MPLAREYDIVLWGATGYTGKYTAQHIVTHLPSNLKWALAGRSHRKLLDILPELQNLNANRLEPGMMLLDFAQRMHNYNNTSN